MLASKPSQQVESDSRPFGNPSDSVKADRALDMLTRSKHMDDCDGQSTTGPQSRPVWTVVFSGILWLGGSQLVGPNPGSSRHGVTV
jgi:hypothetical protein